MLASRVEDDVEKERRPEGSQEKDARPTWQPELPEDPPAEVQRQHEGDIRRQRDRDLLEGDVEVLRLEAEHDPEALADEEERRVPERAPELVGVGEIRLLTEEPA